MDYFENFDKIKSVIQHCHKYVKPINTIQFPSEENEQFIVEITRRLQEVLLEQNLIHPRTLSPLPNAHQSLQKILMCLFANTDTTYIYNLAEVPNFISVVEQCPAMPKFLLIALIWELQFEQYFYEALSYAPCWFGCPYLKPASDYLKHYDEPLRALVKIEEIMRALCICIARSEYLLLDMTDRKNIYNELYDYTLNLLHQFFSPDVKEFEETEDYYSYLGFALKHISGLVIFAFDLFEFPENIKPNIDTNTYETCESLSEKVAPQDTLSPSHELKEQQIKIIKAMLNFFEFNIMLVNVDSYMNWMYVQVTPNLNLQEVADEMVGKVEQRVSGNPLFANDGLQHIKSHTIRSKTLEEIIEGATNCEIVHKLKERLSPREKKKWLDQLFQRSTALGNKECLETIKENIELMKAKNCKSVLAFLKKSIQLSEERSKNEQEMKVEKTQVDMSQYETLLSVLFEGLQYLKEGDILKLIVLQIKYFNDCGIVCFQRADYEQRVTAFLSKFTTTFAYREFLILCFENPSRMWAAFFDNACQDLKHVRNFCAIAKKALLLSNIYFNKKFVSALRDPSKLMQKNFPHLLCEIYFVVYCPNKRTEFLKSIIYKHVNKFLDMKAFDQLLPIVKSLNLITRHEETYSNKPLNFGEVTPPVLLMTAQIMNNARWDVLSFTEERDELVRECIHFIRATAKRFLPMATAKDRKWMTSIINEYHAFTKYYFQEFLVKPGEPQAEFNSFLMQSEFGNELDDQEFVIKTYIRCTKKETEWLARSARLLPHISEAMIILGGCITEVDNPNAIDNYRHCIFNYRNIVQQFLLPPIVNDNSAIEKLVMTVLKIIKAAPEHIYEESFINTSSLLKEIMDACACPLVKDSEIVQSVQNFVSGMKDCAAKESFNADMQVRLLSECPC